MSSSPYDDHDVHVAHRREYEEHVHTYRRPKVKRPWWKLRWQTYVFMGLLAVIDRLGAYWHMPWYQMVSVALLSAVACGIAEWRASDIREEERS